MAASLMAQGGITAKVSFCDVTRTVNLDGATIDVFDKEPYSGRLEKLNQCPLIVHVGSMTAI